MGLQGIDFLQDLVPAGIRVHQYRMNISVSGNCDEFIKIQRGGYLGVQAGEDPRCILNDVV